jgi:hypothetical protein
MKTKSFSQKSTSLNKMQSTAMELESVVITAQGKREKGSWLCCERNNLPKLSKGNRRRCCE